MEPESCNENEITTLKLTWQKVCKEKIEETCNEYMIKNNLQDKFS